MGTGKSPEPADRNVRATMWRRLSSLRVRATFLSPVPHPVLITPGRRRRRVDSNQLLPKRGVGRDVWLVGDAGHGGVVAQDPCLVRDALPVAEHKIAGGLEGVDSTGSRALDWCLSFRDIADPASVFFLREVSHLSFVPPVSRHLVSFPSCRRV